MYITDRLVETLQEKCHIVIRSSVHVFKQTYHSLNVQCVDQYINPLGIYPTTVKDLPDVMLDLIVEYVNLIADIDVSSDDVCYIITNETEPHGFWLDELRNKNGQKPTVAEVNQWQQGLLMLNIHEISIFVHIDDKPLNNAVLCDFLCS